MHDQRHQLTADPPLVNWFADNDGDLLHISRINGQALVNGNITLTTANGGTITVHDDGTFVYTPTADLEYVDTLTFTVFDGIAEVSANLFIHIGYERHPSSKHRPIIVESANSLRRQFPLDLPVAT